VSTDPIDFIARRRAAIEAKRVEYLEWLMEDQFEKELESLQYDFHEQMEREREARRKYEEAMAQKRAAVRE
jgi:DNA-directed RNA polymerase beta subunit